MKTLSRILGAAASLALASPFALLAQQEPIIAVDITTIGIASGTGSVIDVAITAGGSGYVTVPKVTVTGGGGFGAEFAAVVTGGAVTGITITKGGFDYTAIPALTIDPPGKKATASAVIASNQVDSITVNDGGDSYLAAPQVTITGDGTGAIATATLSSDGKVASITMTSKGTGYTTATVVIAPPGTEAKAVVRTLGQAFVQPFQNESYGGVGTTINISALARGTSLPYTYTFFVNGTQLGTAAGPAGVPTTYSWAPPQPGAYLLTVRATDGLHTETSLAVRYFATGTAFIGPVDNTLVPNGSSLVLQATATPAPTGPNAFVQRMDFYVDDQLVGSDHTYPYSFIYTPSSSPAKHVVEARGFDNNGNQISPAKTAIRNIFMVSPIGTPPSVKIVNPPDGGRMVAGTTAGLTADATAPDGFIKNVDFYVNGVALGSTNKFPFVQDWTPQVPGEYEIIAIGFDDKSNAVSSPAAHVIVTGAFPTAEIVEPGSSGLTVVQGSVVPVTVRAVGPDGGISSLKTVEFLVDGVVNEVLPKVNSGGTSGSTSVPVLTDPFIFNWKSNVAIGVHRIAARATGNNGLSITSAELTVNVVPNQAPRISITAPSEGGSTTVNLETVITTAPTDADGTVESVEFFVNGASVGTATKAPFQFTWKPTVNGEAILTAKAIDNGGKSAVSDSVKVNVDPVAPSGPAQTTISATVFRGSYGSVTENGQFSFAVNRNNRGTFIAYSTSPSGRSSFWTDITVNPDGTFEVRDAANAVVLNGQTSPTGVSGTFAGKTFIGPITSSTSAFTPLLVTGSLTGVAGSQVVAIVGGDSSVTLYAVNGLLRDAGSGFLGSTGAYSFSAPTGGRFAGTVANSAAIVSGTVSGSLSGGFVLRQQTSRITNISTRALAGSGDRTLVAGFVVSGTGTKPLLVRAVGPTLANFGVANPLADPSLNILSRTQAVVANNNDWGNSAALAALFTQVGAFSLTPGSRDAAVQASLTPGTYTAVVGGGATAGNALVEIYDYDASNPATSRITNISTRGQVGAGESLIAGFAITGDLRKKVLIRAVGPTLASFGLTGVLADPKIDVIAGSTVVASNNDWTETATVAQVVATSPGVGAFPLNASSKDAAVVLQLAPGAYTVQISGAANTTGTVLVEIYDADL